MTEGGPGAAAAVPVTLARKAWMLVRQTWKELGQFAVHRMAGALAFFALFGIPPLIVILLTVAGWFLGDDTARAEMLERVEHSIGAESRGVVEGILMNTPRPGEESTALSAFSVVVFIFGATLTFYQLQSMLNEVWGKPERAGIWRFVAVVVKRLITFAMLGVTGLIVVLWLGASMLLSRFPAELAELIPADLVPFVTTGIELILMLFLLTVHFTLTYKVLPDAKVPFRSALFGALLASVLFLVARKGVQAFLAHRDLGTAFGAAGSLVVTLVWVYAAALITLVGGVFSKTYTRWRERVQALTEPAG